MASIPERVASLVLARDGKPLARYLSTLGWQQSHQGKVRDTYSRADKPDELLVVATDRLSIFDFVLPETVPSKGAALTGLTHFCLTEVFPDVPNHLIGVPEDPNLPRERCLLVKKVDVDPFEMIFRAHIGGSIFKDYVHDGTAAGQALLPGLQKWQQLGAPIFTPSTKAEIGHDENITVARYFQEVGEDEGREVVQQLLSVYVRAYTYAFKRGVRILDTKFEVSRRPFMLVDEVLTPDSSRYTPNEDYERAMLEGKDPIFLDKEPVREWGRHVETPFDVVGIHKLKPENPEHVQFVHSLEVPSEVVSLATARYLRLFEIMAEMPLRKYQETRMGITV